MLTTRSSDECVTEPCEEATRAQHTEASDCGITGVVAYNTDSCIKGCCECSFMLTQLSVYEVSQPVTHLAQVEAQLSGTAE